jgi:hypothetical protein
MCKVFQGSFVKTLHIGIALGYEKSREYAAGHGLRPLLAHATGVSHDFTSYSAAPTYY